MENSEAKILLCTVGLPTSGKSYLATRIKRYLNWRFNELRVKRFNAKDLASTEASDKALDALQQ